MGNDHQNEHRNGHEMSTAPALWVSELMQTIRASELSCRRLFEAARLKARVLQNTTLNRASFSIIAIDLAPLNPSTPPALLKATKPTTTLQRRVQACRQTMQTMLQGIPCQNQ
jgi:hypothetical protein